MMARDRGEGEGACSGSRIRTRRRRGGRERRLSAVHAGEIVPKGEVEWRRHPETVFVAPFPFGTSCVWEPAVPATPHSAPRARENDAPLGNPSHDRALSVARSPSAISRMNPERRRTHARTSPRITASARHAGRFEILVDGAVVATLSLDGIERLGIAHRRRVFRVARESRRRRSRRPAHLRSRARDACRAAARRARSRAHARAKGRARRARRRRHRSDSSTLGVLDDAQFARQFIRAQDRRRGTVAPAPAVGALAARRRARRHRCRAGRGDRGG